MNNFNIAEGFFKHIVFFIRTVPAMLKAVGSRPRAKARPRPTFKHQKASVGLSTDNADPLVGV